VRRSRQEEAGDTVVTAPERPAERAGWDREPRPARPAGTAETALFWAATLALGLLALLSHGYRLRYAPDIFADEALYVVVGQSLARGAGLVTGDGTFFWHPPLYLIVEGAFIRLAGLAEADLFTALYTVRYLNVVLSAGTAVLLSLFGRRLHSPTAGVLMAGLFLLDPYVQRINRRGMLETLAMLLALLGLYLFFTHRPGRGRGRLLGAAAALGLSLLTKEVMFVELVVLVGFALLARRALLRPALVVSFLACLPYLLFPLWAYLTGRWETFVRFRLYNLAKYLNLVSPLDQDARDTGGGVTRAASGVFWQNLVYLFDQYAMSYLVIALAALAIVFLARRRRDAPAQLMAVWSATTFAFIGFGLTVGKISDHFFYYLMVPAIAVVAYVLAEVLERAAAATRDQPGARLVPATVAALLVLIGTYNVHQWVETYGTGVDDGYFRLHRYVVEHVPVGSQIVPSGDLSNYLFGDRYSVQFHRDRQNVVVHEARYFVFSSKEGLLRYNSITPEFYGWLMQSAPPLFETTGPTFWRLGLYYRDPNAEAVGVMPAAPVPAAFAGQIWSIALGAAAAVFVIRGLRPRRALVPLAALAVGTVTFAVHGYRLAYAPDVFSDEALYMLVGTNVARGVGLVGDQGLFFWHPPLYMLVEGAFIQWLGLIDADVLTAVFAVRHLNVAFSALTAGLLVLLGRSVLSTRAGLIMAGLFLLDPYVQRTNRRGMLETLAMLLTLLGLYLFFTRRLRVPAWRVVAAGGAFGLAVLTKELMVVPLIALLLYTARARPAHFGAAVRVALIAAVPYAPYALWAYASGAGREFVQYKMLNVTRYLNLAGLLDPSIGAAGGLVTRLSEPLFWQNLALLLTQYATSYLVIAAAAGLTAWLLLRGRGKTAGRYLAAWSALSYAFVGFGLTVGRISDQFFYYLMVPAIIVVGYSLAALRWWRPGVLGPLMALCVLYNGGLWLSNYGVGTDNAYSRVYAYVQAHVPPGATIVAGSDVSNYLFGDRYQVRFYRDSEVVEAAGARYFVLSSKDAWARHNAMTPAFYGWVMGNTHPLVEAEGASFWRLGVYRRDPAAPD
jgi:4-amino-4-deoxy-L-arabinose transferase-like glycosyltransferase